VTITEVERHFTTVQAGDQHFDDLARTVLAYQRTHCEPYRRYCAALGTETYLPVEAFKHGPLTTFPPEEAELVFHSSGTGRGIPAVHHVRRAAVYERSATAHFRQVFGSDRRVILAHLPHYHERGERSSLVHMVRTLIEHFGAAGSGFFLDDRTLLHRAVDADSTGSPPIMVFGAAFGLLDLVESVPVPLPADAVVIETGGMKTFRREISRASLHERLSEGFGIDRDRVYSEYGMCELLSQAYSRGGEDLYFPPWVCAEVVDPEDPTRVLPDGVPGALAILDLANMYAVSAILTQDRAVRHGDGFRILGRLSHAELRGCNFLLENITDD
jgi:hypothetical protein